MEEKNHFRAPLTNTFRKKSPFNLLSENMLKICQCGKLLLEDELIRYYSEDFSTIEETSKKVSKLEHEADLIKGNLRNHLPKSIFMPVDKGKFLRALSEQDSILDHADNLARMLYMRHTVIPEDLRDIFIEHARLSNQTLLAMEKAVESLCKLLQTGFGRKERKKIKEYIHEVHKYEYLADQKRHEATYGIYRIEDQLDAMDVYHLIKIVDWVDDIADHAENVSDWLRAMIAK